MHQGVLHAQYYYNNIIIMIYHKLLTSDESFILLDLWLTILTLQIEKKPLVSLLSVKSLPGSEEGSHDKQMTPGIFSFYFFSMMFSDSTVHPPAHAVSSKTLHGLPDLMTLIIKDLL